MIELNTLHCGDCLELMKEIQDNSIDCIICDLPYGTTACKWDVIIPFDELWEQYNRITKESAAVLLFGAEPFSSMLRLANIKAFKYDWYWRKPRGTCHLNAKKQPLRDIETISVFYTKQCTYNPQYEKGEPYSALKSGKTAYVCEAGKTTYGRFKNGAAYRNDNDGFRYPKQCIEFGVVERGTLHPTQKPVDLLRYLIRTYTNENDVILDNCMGSGSTCVAAIKENRKYIGIEKEPTYFDIAKRRIDNELSQLHLF